MIQLQIVICPVENKKKQFVLIAYQLMANLFNQYQIDRLTIVTEMIVIIVVSAMLLFLSYMCEVTIYNITFANVCGFMLILLNSGIKLFILFGTLNLLFIQCVDMKSSVSIHRKSFIIVLFYCCVMRIIDTIYLSVSILWRIQNAYACYLKTFYFTDSLGQNFPSYGKAVITVKV